MNVPQLPGPEAVLAVRGLSQHFADRVLLDGLDLEVQAGQSVAVVGPSGSGKSTLLNCLLGLVRPTAGSVRIAGTEITGLRPRAAARHRQATTGMVFQFGELLPELAPDDNVALAAMLSRTGRRTAYPRARALLKQLGVPDVSTTDKLSGGERQRVALARALVNSPALLLADEPTGALDEDTRDQVADLLFSLPREQGCALVVVTHDLQIAARADRCLRLRSGRLEEVDRRFAS